MMVARGAKSKSKSASKDPQDGMEVDGVQEVVALKEDDANGDVEGEEEMNGEGGEEGEEEEEEEDEEGEYEVERIIDHHSNAVSIDLQSSTVHLEMG